jgi:hypothetical protein
MRQVALLIAVTAVAAAMGMPLRLAAQASTPPAASQQATPAPVVTLPPTPKAPVVSPSQHLADAKQVLDGMPPIQHPSNVRDRMARLRKSFADMVSAYATGTSVPSGPTDKVTPTPVEWQNKFFDIERDLADWIGGTSLLVFQPIESAAAAGSQASASARPAAVPGATGTAGTVGEVTVATASIGTAASSGAAASSTSPPAPAAPLAVQSSDEIASNGKKDLDVALRTELERFRLHVELFFDSATSDRH